MAKIWVDPSPGGWRYGFPKLYDKKKDGPDLKEWLVKQGYPRDLADVGIVRQWNYSEED